MKRMIGILLVMVVGCGTETQSPKTTVESQTTESSIFEMDSFDDVEPELVRNENGEVIEFGWYSETEPDLEQLRDMPELETLDLGGTQITDAGLVHLKALPNLQSLDLFGCPNITESGVAELQKALPNCEIIR